MSGEFINAGANALNGVNTWNTSAALVFCVVVDLVIMFFFLKTFKEILLLLNENISENTKTLLEINAKVDTLSKTRRIKNV